MSKLNLFIPITKIDEENRLVYGVITKQALDKANEVMDYELSKPNFEKWSAGFDAATGGQSVGNLRVMHGSTVAGKFTQIGFDDDSQTISGCAKVVDDNEWQKTLEGCYTGFSIGGSYGKVTKEAGGVRRYEAKPSEVSLVDNPCLGEATFTVVKADGTTELRKFHQSADDEAVKLEKRARELATAAGADPDEILAAATAETIEVRKWHGFVEDARREGNRTPDGVVQKWLASDGKAFDSKAEAVAHDGVVKAEAVAKTIAAPAAEAMAKLDAALNRIEGKPADAGLTETELAEITKATGLTGEALTKFVAEAEPELVAMIAKREFTDKARAKDADTGAAMPDGSFPIVNKSDLSNAVRAYGRAKNKAAAKAHIITRAKALGATDELPQGWDGSTAKKGEPVGALRKGMYAVGRLASLLESLSWLRVEAKNEREIEGDDSKVPDQLDAQVASLGGILVAMATEEVRELAMYGVDPADASDMDALLACSDNPAGLVKFLADMAEPVQPLHDGLAKAAGRLDAAKEELGKLAKRAGDGSRATGAGDGPDALSKAEGDALRKLVATMTLSLEKAVARIEHLESLPGESKGVVRVFKHQDGDDSGAGDGATEELAKLLDGMTESEKVAALMKASMANGVALSF